MSNTPQHKLPIAVIGAGPVGLVAAAHLASRGLDFVVLEKGASAGAHVAEWGHVRMFSPWKYNIDPLAARMLRARGWSLPEEEAYPTGAELRDRWLLPLATLPELAGNVRYQSEVLGVSRAGVDRLASAGREMRPFELRLRGADGSEENLQARAVLDASGTWGSPKPLGATGLPAIGELDAGELIYYGMPNLARDEVLARYGGKRVAVVGGGDSAFNTILEFADPALAQMGTKIYWVVRGDLPTFGGGDADQLPRRAALATSVRQLVERGALEVRSSFRIASVERVASGLRLVSDDGDRIEVDEAIGVTGFRPELEILRELRLDLDPPTEAPNALGPLIDPNLHSCGTVPPHGYEQLQHPDKGIFLVGMKSYGRAPTFLLLTGYEQVRSVAAALAGDLESARTVSLTLPETGVCSGDLGSGPSLEEPVCCGQENHAP